MSIPMSPTSYTGEELEELLRRYGPFRLTGPLVISKNSPESNFQIFHARQRFNLFGQLIRLGGCTNLFSRINDLRHVVRTQTAWAPDLSNGLKAPVAFFFAAAMKVIAFWTSGVKALKIAL